MELIGTNAIKNNRVQLKHLSKSSELNTGKIHYIKTILFIKLFHNFLHIHYLHEIIKICATDGKLQYSIL